jgi:hypothetical protein
MSRERLALPSEERELARLRGKLTERDWQAQVVQLAQLYGWRTYHTLRSQGSEAGFPDLVLVRPPMLLFAELKTDRGRIAPAQREWLGDFELVAAAAGAAVHVDVWRPSDFDRVHRLLRPREAT